MKNKIFTLILSLGWVLLALFLASGYFYNKMSDSENTSAFTPITWKSHKAMFEGAVACSLNSQELADRVERIKEDVFSRQINKVENENGFTYYFEDDEKLLNNIFELVEMEKACCPFFKFDISILPFQKGIALQISGSEAAKDFLAAFETDVF